MPVLFPTDTFLPVWQQRVECEDELTRQARLRAAMQRNAVGILERAASANVRSAEAAITRYFGSREKKNAEDWNEWGRIQDQCALVVADIGHFELVTQVPLVPSFVADAAAHVSRWHCTAADTLANACSGRNGGRATEAS